MYICWVLCVIILTPALNPLLADTPADYIKRVVTEVPAASDYYPGLPAHMAGGSALIVAGYWIDPDLYTLAHTVARLAQKNLGPGKTEKKEKLTKQQIKEKKEEVSQWV